MHFNYNEITTIAGQIITKAEGQKSTNHATILTFSGDLGAGKTTMIQEIARQLGVADHMQSPTFVIYKIYETSHSHFKKLVHGDMYRLESSDDIKKLGWDEIIANPNNLVCIEWPEKIADAIPNWAMRIMLSHDEKEEERSIDIVVNK